MCQDQASRLLFHGSLSCLAQDRVAVGSTSSYLPNCLAFFYQLNPVGDQLLQKGGELAIITC